MDKQSGGQGFIIDCCWSVWWLFTTCL